MTALQLSLFCPIAAASVVLLTLGAGTLGAQHEPRVPLVTGLTLVAALRFPEGDRENVIVVTEASDAGAHYVWRYEQSAGGGRGKTHRAEFERFVRASDLASAPRLDQVFLSGGPAESPGFTAFSISRAIYRRLQEEKQVPFTITSVQGAGSIGATLGNLGAAFETRVVLRGTLSLPSSRPEPMPVLLNGHPVTVPTLRLVGHFNYQGRSAETHVGDCRQHASPRGPHGDWSRRSPDHPHRPARRRLGGRARDAGVVSRRVAWTLLRVQQCRS